MARVTIEDCIEIIPNRFELTILASQRTRAIANDAPVRIEPGKNKSPVVALREIAEKAVKPEELQEQAVVAHQKNPQQTGSELIDYFNMDDWHIKAWTAEESDGAGRRGGGVG